jgi:two-component system, OmpR family, alkaline phosphatase synthesis response regulator PhoP
MDVESAHAGNLAKRVLLIEDDPILSDLLVGSLVKADYEVIHERGSGPGLEAALNLPLDLVVMDLTISALDGMASIKAIARRKPALAIIVLSARSDREGMLECFELGVLDYVAKPFDLDLLLARIQACLRRGTRVSPEFDEGTCGPPAPTGDLVLDRDARVIRTPTGQMSLNRKEHDLLELLLSRPGHLFTREEIMQQVWHQRYLPVSRSLDVHVRHLRVKLEACDAGMSLQTVRGIGHRLVPRETSPLTPSFAHRNKSPVQGRSPHHRVIDIE